MKLLSLSAIILLIAVVSSCSKKDDNNNTGAQSYGSYPSMDSVFNQLSVKSKFVTLDAVTGGSFYGNSGTRYVLQPNSFQDAAGVAVTGTVQIEVAEYLHKGDMIFSKVLPISVGEPLISGGELYINATQSGQNIYLKPGFTFKANVPQNKTPPSGLTFFRGQKVEDPINTVAWKSSDTGYTDIIYNGNGDTISIISDSLHWCNADKFLTAPNYQHFKVTIALTGTTITSSSAIKAYALYDNYNGLWPLGFGSRTDNVYSEEHVPDVPVHFVVFGVVNSRFYGGVTAATPKTGGNYTVTLTEVDPLAFKGQINALY
jgi:hypothetical protein